VNQLIDSHRQARGTSAGKPIEIYPACKASEMGEAPTALPMERALPSP